jgi:hypothetical protein
LTVEPVFQSAYLAVIQELFVDAQHAALYTCWILLGCYLDAKSFKDLHYSGNGLLRSLSAVLMTMTCIPEMIPSKRRPQQIPI